MSRRHFAGGLCSCGLGLALSGCATTATPPASDTVSAPTPALDLRPSYRPQPGTDEAGLWLQADKAEQEVRRSNLLIRDRGLNDYVRDLACRIGGEYCQDIRVYIVRNPYFNAMMAPNGMMQIWSGLLFRTRNEAQLAAVIGHELGHYARRHMVERMRDARTKSDLGVFFALGLGLPGMMINMAMISSIFSFSRDQEREADAFGLERMARAGYAPLEAAHVWEQLIAEEAAATDKQDRGYFFATHPDFDRTRANSAHACDPAPVDRSGRGHH